VYVIKKIETREYMCNFRGTRSFVRTSSSTVHRTHEQRQATARRQAQEEPAAAHGWAANCLLEEEDEEEEEAMCKTSSWQP
jgi:hypothetical protein